MKKMVVILNGNMTGTIIEEIEECLTGIFSLKPEVINSKRWVITITFDPLTVDTDQMFRRFLEQGCSINYFCEIA